MTHPDAPRSSQTPSDPWEPMVPEQRPTQAPQFFQLPPEPAQVVQPVQRTPEYPAYPYPVQYGQPHPTPAPPPQHVGVPANQGYPGYQANQGYQAHGHQVQPAYPQQIVINNVVPGVRKSVGVAFVLTFLFGPFGMFYSTVSGALIMVLGGGLVTLISAGLGALLVWPASIVWGCVAASQQNAKLAAQQQQFYR